MRLRDKHRQLGKPGAKNVHGDIYQLDCRNLEIVREFKQELRLKGRAKATIDTYCRHVILFLKWIRLPPGQVSDSNIKTYISSLYTKRYALNSIKIKIRAFKQFYKYLHETGRVLLDPTQNIEEPAAKRVFPRPFLSTTDMDAIRQSIPETSLMNLRDRAIIEVLYATGLRLSELAALNIMDLNLVDGTLTVRNGKGGRDRHAILSKDAVKAIKKYLNLRQVIPDDSPALWINYKGKRLSKLWIQRMVKHAARQAGVKSPAHPHAWRHGLATALLRRGASIRHVQIFLGHQSIKTTEIYTHLTIQDLIDVHNRTHPREIDPIPDFLPLTALNRHE